MSDIYTALDAGSPIPAQPTVQDVRSNIRRAGFFTRFGKEYKASVQLAKTWLGHDEHTKIKRADLVSELDQFWSGVKRLSNFSFASFLGFTSRSKHQLRSIRGAVADVRARYRDAGVSETLFPRLLNDPSVSRVAEFLRTSQDTLETWGDLDSAINVLDRRIEIQEHHRDALHQAEALCRDISIGRVAELRQLLAVSNDNGELQNELANIYSYFGFASNSEGESFAGELSAVISKLQEWPAELVNLFITRKSPVTEASFSPATFHAAVAGVLAPERGGAGNWQQVLQQKGLITERVAFFDAHAEEFNAAAIASTAVGITTLSQVKSLFEISEKITQLQQELETCHAALNLTADEASSEFVDDCLDLIRRVDALPEDLSSCLVRTQAPPVYVALEQLTPSLTTLQEIYDRLREAKGLEVIESCVAHSRDALASHVKDDAGFNKLLACKNIGAAAIQSGLGDFLNLAEREDLLSEVEKLAPGFLVYHLKAAAQKQYGNRLNFFAGPTLDTARESLKNLDLQLIEMAPKAVVAQACRMANPPAGIGRGKKSDFTVALIRHQLGLKRRISPRKLIPRANSALAQLFPCWMMVPSSVAQLLPRKQVFDLVIIDEASQMTPENSISGLMRARSALISGDTNQLPPTNFFRSLSTDEDEDEDVATPEESILEKQMLPSTQSTDCSGTTGQSTRS